MTTPRSSHQKSPARVAAADLDRLLESLMVQFVWLSECLVGEGYRLEMGSVPAPGIHYNIAGVGQLIINDDSPIELTPHTMIIVPPNSPFRIEVPARRRPGAALKTVDGRAQTRRHSAVHRVVASDGEPDVVLICGYFEATYGASSLFGRLTVPIVERFGHGDHVDEKLKAALAELMRQEVGFGTMSASLLKQVIIALLRRSLRSFDLWIERFVLLSDPQIARAFAEMVANPGARHSVQSLARTACLSRSAFSARFTNVVGQSPMVVLRNLRMRKAAEELRSGKFTVDEIVHHTGYASRSSFVRAFRHAFGSDPSSYRKASARPAMDNE